MTTPVQDQAESQRVRLLLVGHGRMGRLVETLAPEYGCEVVGVIDEVSNDQGAALRAWPWNAVDVAVDFSIPEAVVENLPLLAARGTSLIVGTTGWRVHEPALRRVAEEAGIGVVAAPNFSTGVVLFEAIVEQAARLFAQQPEYGLYVHEIHHAAKRDAPSGTALALKAAMERAGYERTIDVASNRAGSIPGTHVVGIDGPAETVTLSHVVRDRSTFARGALHAARWVRGRRGWFNMRDVLGLTGTGEGGGR